MAQKQPPYVGGVGTIAAGGTIFTVTGALDDTNCIEGDHVRGPVDGYESRVLERLTVQTFRVPPWRGAALVAAPYELYPDSSLRGGYQAAVTTQLLARLSAKGLVWILPPEFASPTAAKWGADEGQYVFSPSLKLWWVMQAGAWTPTGAPYGMMAANALSEISGLGLAATARSNLDLVKQISATDDTAGRVLTVGAFGLGAVAGVGSGNIQDARPPGRYFANSIAGTPNGENGWFDSQYLSASYYDLVFTSAVTGERYNKTKIAGTWSDWRHVVTSTTLSAAANLNDVRPSGWYYCSTVTNGPTSANGWLEHRQLNNTYAIQSFVPSDTGIRYSRALLGGVWSAWLRGDVEWGSNSNGTYARFQDGTQICWFAGTRADIALTAYGSIFQGDKSLTFPISFFTAPVGAITQCSASGNRGWGTVTNTSTSGITMCGFDIVARSSGTTFFYSYTAHGRWKA